MASGKDLTTLRKDLMTLRKDLITVGKLGKTEIGISSEHLRVHDSYSDGPLEIFGVFS